jgi:hypothetical protein
LVSASLLASRFLVALSRFSSCLLKLSIDLFPVVPIKLRSCAAEGLVSELISAYIFEMPLEEAEKAEA